MTCSVSADGSVDSQTACANGNITLNASVSVPGDSTETISLSGGTLTFMAGMAEVTNQAVTEGDRAAGETPVANGWITVEPTGAGPSGCASGFIFEADLTITE